MTTDNPMALCVPFLADDIALISMQAAAHGVSAEDWVRETLRKALETERVEVLDVTPSDKLPRVYSTTGGSLP